MRIQNNITAMNTHRQYTINNDNVAKSAEKLSSGYRINRAGDDAAGLAISEKMRSQIRGLNMATKNSQDAISLIQTAEGALQETHSMLQRMNELAVQAATGTNQEFDRTQAAKEFEQLKREINDVAEQTTFNNMKVLDGSISYNGYVRSAATAGVTITKQFSEDAATSAAANTPGGTIESIALDAGDKAAAPKQGRAVTVTLTGDQGTKIEFATDASTNGTDTVDALLQAKAGADNKLTSKDGKWTASYNSATGKLENLTNTEGEVKNGETFTIELSSQGTNFAAASGAAKATSAAEAALMSSATKVSTDGTTGTANTLAAAQGKTYAAPAAGATMTIGGTTYAFKASGTAAAATDIDVDDVDTADKFVDYINTLIQNNNVANVELKNNSGEIIAFDPRTDGNGTAPGATEITLPAAWANGGTATATWAAGTLGDSIVAKDTVDSLKAGDTLVVDGKKIELAEDDVKDVASLVSKINTELGANAKVTASDGGDGSLVITAKQADPEADTSVKLATGNTSSAASEGPTTIELDFAKMYEGDEITVDIGGKSVSIAKKAGDTKETFLARIDQELQTKGVTDAQRKGSAIVVKGDVTVGTPEFAKDAQGNVTGDVTQADTKKYATEAMRIQVGALENEQLNISIDSMNTAGLGLDAMNLETQDAAGKAITAVRSAVNKVSDQRATLGAMQNRLDHKIANLKVSSENLSAAESRIRDVDMASEMTNFTKNNILSQAATAMLAQANALPQNVLSLLG